MTNALISVLALTGLVRLVTKVTKKNICPVCAGVSLTWLGLWLGLLVGKLPPTDYELPAAILMGGTVVGAMAKLERYIKPGTVMVWKTVFVTTGFLAAYGLITYQWLALVIGVILASAVTLVCRARQTTRAQSESVQAQQLEEKMKKCC